MAVQSPTAARLTSAVINDPSLYLARVLYSNTSVQDLAANLVDGSPSLEFTHFRVRKNQNREQPGTISMRHVPFAPSSRSFLGIESVKAVADLFRHEVPLDRAQTMFSGPLGLDSAKAASEQLGQAILNDCENRMATDLSTDANFGFVGTQTDYGNWGDSANDPMRAVRDAWASILDLGGPPRPGFKVVMAFCQADYDAWKSNAFIRDYRGMTGGAITTSFIEEILRDELLGGLPEEIRAAFSVRVHTAARVAGNQGQAEKASSPTAPTRFVTDRSQLVIVGPENDIQERSWGRWISALQPIVEVYEGEREFETVYRGFYADKPTIYDADMGATFNSMTTVPS